MDVLDINAPEIQAELLFLQSQFKERKASWEDCAKSAYDIIAKHQLKSGVRLTDLEIRNLIPATAFEVALAFHWIPDPHKREHHTKVFKYSSYFERTFTFIERVNMEIPECELTERLGSVKVTPATRQWWLNILAGRIPYWQGVALKATTSLSAVRSNADETPIPKRTLKKPNETQRAARAREREAVVQPLLDGKKPERWTPNFWASKARLNSPHAVYRYLRGENISADNRQKLAEALGSPIPD